MASANNGVEADAAPHRPPLPARLLLGAAPALECAAGTETTAWFARSLERASFECVGVEDADWFDAIRSEVVAVTRRRNGRTPQPFRLIYNVHLKNALEGGCHMRMRHYHDGVRVEFTTRARGRMEIAALAVFPHMGG
jgi:hypothetical protein